MVSNFDARAPRLVKELELAPLFDGTVFSSEVGFEKPDPAIFETLLERLSGRASRRVMLGDRPSIDLKPARQLGWETVLFKSEDSRNWEQEIESWDQVFDLLSG